MKNLQELFYQLKFAYHLKKKGLLEALVSEIKDFERKYFYPTLIDKKMILFESIFKSISEIEDKGKVNDNKKIAEKITEEIWNKMYGNQKADNTKDILEDLYNEGQIYQIVKKVVEELKKGQNKNKSE